MVVGGYAVAFHGYPRFTKDIDIFYKNDDENIRTLKSALIEFGFNSEDLPDDVFKTPGNIITFGVEPVRVDILNEIDGIGFDDAWNNHVQGKYGNTVVNFIGKNDLIKNKTSTKRLQDKADAQNLTE
jgi:hypothetical protein